MENWYIWWNKTGFLQNSSCIYTTVQMHYMDTDKTYGEKVDKKCTGILRAILNKFWKQHHAKKQLYGYLPPISKTIQVRRTRHAEAARTNTYAKFYGSLHMDVPLVDQEELTYNSSVRTWDVVKKIFHKWWMIGTHG